MTESISHHEVRTLLFGQQHILSQFFFTERLGQYHTVELHQLPHYELLSTLGQHANAGDSYAEYLNCSWRYYYGDETNTPERRRGRIESYLKLYHEIRSCAHLGEAAIQEPITVCERVDGRTVIVDGNHRATIAANLGLGVRLNKVPMPEQLSQIATVPDEFYGSKRLNLPYQSIFNRGKELIKGRRPDVLERMNKVAESDLRGRSVLELGCNFGANCFLAAERGAASAVGIEVSPAIASAAVRLNAYLALPCFFMAWDLNRVLANIPTFDTVFCFSVVDHVKNKAAITETLKRTVGRVLYFEGHAGSRLEDYRYVLNQDNFSAIDLLSYGRDGIDSDASTRPLFRCEVTPSIRLDAQPEFDKPVDASWLFAEGSVAWKATLSMIQERAEAGPSAEATVIRQEIASNVGDGKFIIVDEEQLRTQLDCGDRAVPFLEREGQYWGLPADDETAIAELQRLRLAGAQYIIFISSTYWWLDHYPGLREVLRSQFRYVRQNERVTIYDLRSQSTSSSANL